MWALLSYRIISVPPHLSHPNCSISVLGHHYWQGINPPRLFRKEVYRKVPHRKVWQKLKGTYVVRKEGWFPRALSSSRRVSTLLQWKWEFVSRQVSGETWFTCSTDCTASNCRMYQNTKQLNLWRGFGKTGEFQAFLIPPQVQGLTEAASG